MFQFSFKSNIYYLLIKDAQNFSSSLWPVQYIYYALTTASKILRGMDDLRGYIDVITI